MRYYIRNCKGEIVGNPKGYRTFKGASRQMNGTRTKAGRQIWEAFQSRENLENRHLATLNTEPPQAKP